MIIRICAKKISVILFQYKSQNEKRKMHAIKLQQEGITVVFNKRMGRRLCTLICVVFFCIFN